MTILVSVDIEKEVVAALKDKFNVCLRPLPETYNTTLLLYFLLGKSHFDCFFFFLLFSEHLIYDTY